MVKIELQSVAVGTVFPYNSAFSETNLNRYLSEGGFELTDREDGLNITPDGIGVGPNPIYAHKGQLQVLLNQEAGIEGLANSSFLTFKDPVSANAEKVLSEVEDFWTDYDGFDIKEERAFAELTIEGQIQIEKNVHSLTHLLDQESLSPLSNLSDSESEGVAVHMQADQPKDSPGWYRLQLSSEAVGNPHIWAFKIVKRYNNYKDVDVDLIRQSIRELVENTASE